LTFTMDRTPAIAPGPSSDDHDGCEDPTVAVTPDGCYVYYTGWNQSEKRGMLMLASGPTLEGLQKHGVALPSTAAHRNPKEATIVRAEDGTWRLFFAFAANDASMIGVASSPSVDGPWTVGTVPFAARSGSWDDWHLSTGPITVGPNSLPVMFYNGATKDAKWRIGWVMFDRSYRSIVARCTHPVIVPPKPAGDETDIAFAASAIHAGDDVWLYYSIADKTMKRAVLRCEPL
jgi:beta-1,2-mannobiose phosphorylase / 1,2-beta-oligomannan phosphorylase